MKILVTGAKGFIGKNLIVELKNQKYTDIYEYDIDTEPSLLDIYTKDCDFVFHLAGVNRPQNQNQYMEGNFGFTSRLLESLIKNKNTCPGMYSSSIQAALDNPYGKSKKAGEDLLFEYGNRTGAKFLFTVSQMYSANGANPTITALLQPSAIIFRMTFPLP